MIPSRNYACILTVTVYIYNILYCAYIRVKNQNGLYPCSAAHVWFVYTLRVTISCTFSGLYNVTICFMYHVCIVWIWLNICIVCIYMHINHMPRWYMGGVKPGWVLFGPRQGKSQQLRCSEGTHAHDTHVATWSLWLANHPSSGLWVKSLGIGAVFDLSTLNLGVLTLDLKSCWENRSFDSHIHAIWTKPSYAIVLRYHFGPYTINIHKSYQDISESLSWTCQWGRACKYWHMGQASVVFFGMVCTKTSNHG